MIEKSNIEYVANLSRLKLTDDEKDLFVVQLDNIFNYINKLNELNTENVIPMSNATVGRNIFREDNITSSLPKEQALSNSTAHSPHFFKVPKVLD